MSQALIPPQRHHSNANLQQQAEMSVLLRLRLLLNRFVPRNVSKPRAARVLAVVGLLLALAVLNIALSARTSKDGGLRGQEGVEYDTLVWEWKPPALMHVTTGLCLDVVGGRINDGAPLQLWDCVGQKNQHWVRHGNGVANPHQFKCLDVYSARRVQLWSCAHSVNQGFVETPAGLLRSIAFPGQCLHAEDRGRGSRVGMAPCPPER